MTISEIILLFWGIPAIVNSIGFVVMNWKTVGYADDTDIARFGMGWVIVVNYFLTYQYILKLLHNIKSKFKKK